MAMTAGDARLTIADVTPEAPGLERIACPCCGAREVSPWATERGINLVRCADCRLLYVNPRPSLDAIDDGVRLGEHRVDGQRINVRARRVARKIGPYKRLFGRMFRQRIGTGQPMLWVDYGAGYGEILEAVRAVMPAHSEAIGIEPMTHKAEKARSLGLDVRGGYPHPEEFRADVVSMVNIFSHIPDFYDVLRIARSNLKPTGELFIETGNLADLDSRHQFPGILDLPDHLVFSGEAQMAKYLQDTRFEIAEIERHRVDGLFNFAKNVVKRLLGRPVILSAPYSSDYRQLMIRARPIAI